MDLTPGELTILGLIVEQPRHGYDLERVIDQRGIREWTSIAFSSIYYLVTKLAERGLVVADPEPTGPRSRRVFRATNEGRHQAERASLALIEDAQPVAHPVLAGIANLPLFDTADYIAALRRRLTEVEGRITSVTAAARSQEPLPPAAQEIFSYSLALLDAEHAWLADRVGATHD